MSIIEEAKKDKRNICLLNELAGIQLNYECCDDNSWGSDMKNNVATISYCDCASPASALTHELLHIKLQFNGYRRIRIGVSNLNTGELFIRLMTCLDNNLQHHKMYPEFVALGYNPLEFYCDSDRMSETYLREVVLRQYHTIIEFVPDFMTLIASGGAISENIKTEIENSFYQIFHGVFEQQLRDIKSEVMEWSESSSNNSSEIFTKIMLVLKPDNNLTWFGYSNTDRPPNDGFFVQGEFQRGIRVRP